MKQDPFERQLHRIAMRSESFDDEDWPRIHLLGPESDVPLDTPESVGTRVKQIALLVFLLFATLCVLAFCLIVSGSK